MRWRIGRLADATGVSVRSLRYYDEIGLLIPSERPTGGHPLYGEADVRRLYRGGDGHDRDDDRRRRRSCAHAHLAARQTRHRAGRHTCRAANERAGDRLLPICVGRGSEGFALVAQLAGGSFSRPVAADLAARLLELSGARIERVAIAAFHDHVFYATVTIRTGEDSQDVDARPTLNLAARLRRPIFVEPGVMDTCAIASDADVEAYLREFQSRPGNVEGPGEWQPLVGSVRRGLER